MRKHVNYFKIPYMAQLKHTPVFIEQQTDGLLIDISWQRVNVCVTLFNCQFHAYGILSSKINDSKVLHDFFKDIGWVNYK